MAKRKKQPKVIITKELIAELRYEVLSQEEKDAMDLKIFKRHIKRFFNRVMQPKTTFNRDQYVLACYSRYNKLQWKMTRTLWNNASLADVRRVFGESWPGLTLLPGHRCYGVQYAIKMLDESGCIFTLHRLEPKGK